MPKIAYQSFNFRQKSLDLISKCNAIIAQYAQQGFQLNLRQLYYQLVARDIIPNNQKSYDNTGSLINDARLAGLIDWAMLEDRTRGVEDPPHWESPDSIVNAVATAYRIDKWRDCKVRPEVWIEKEALAGVIQPTCISLDVGYLSCRGYTSQSEMWRAAQRFLLRAKRGQHTKVIHLGDHDPSGIDMTRDIEERINMFLKHHGFASYFTLERIALNRDQIDEYNPPPNPAKSSDSRFRAYLDEHGDTSWELDALEPSVLADLISDAVLKTRSKKDDLAFDERRSLEHKQRLLLKTCSERWDEVVELLEENLSEDDDEQPED